MSEKLFNQVKQVLIDTLKNNTDTINENSKLKDELGLDSMSSLTFLMALEDNIPGFVVDPATLEMDHLLSVGTITQYVKSQLENSYEA